MTLVTNSKSKTVYGFAWVNGDVLRTRYGYPVTNTVSSVRGEKRNTNSINPFEVIKTSIDFREGRYYDTILKADVSGPSIGLVGLVDMYSGGLPSPSFSFDNGAVKALAIQKAFANATQPYFAEIHQLGELAETVSALKSPMSGVRKLFKKTAKILSSPAKLKLPMKEVAGAYLEHIYGTLPAINQAKTFGTTAARMLDTKYPKYKTFRGGRKIVDEEGKLSMGVYIGGFYRPIFNKRSLSYTIDRKVTKRSSAGIVVSNPRLRNSANFAAIAAEGWELLPLSFLANMFVDLSSLLKECRPVPGRITGSWVTSIVDATYHYTLDEVSSCVTLQPAEVIVHKTWIKREVDIQRTGMLHLGRGLDSIGKIVSTAALGISMK